MMEAPVTDPLPWHLGGNGHGAAGQWLILIIAAPTDADRLLAALVDAGCGATALPGRSELLSQEPMGLMVVATTREVPLILTAVRRLCARRLTYIAGDKNTTLSVVLNPLAEEYGGATLFAVPIRSAARWASEGAAGHNGRNGRGRQMDNLGALLEVAEVASVDTTPTKLVIAVVPDRAADEALAALAQNRLGATTVGSTGGFLRRGSTTIISGVSADEAQRAVGLIRDACLATRAPDAPEQGIAFALDVAWQMRL